MKLRLLLATVLGLATVVAPTGSPAVAAAPMCEDAIFVLYGRHSYNGVVYTYRFTPTTLYPQALGCVSREGDHNNLGVWAMQQMLKRCYNQDIVIDGTFGPQTKSALLNAQTWAKYVEHQVNLDVDGVYGPETQNALRWPMTTEPYSNRPWHCFNTNAG